MLLPLLSLVSVVGGYPPGARPVAPVRVASIAGPADDFEAALGSLRSSDAVERAQAERWLGVHLDSSHRQRLLDAARSGDAELRGRISRALAADPRHLGHAVAFLVDPLPDLARMGEEAIGELLRAWNSDLGEAPRMIDLADVLRGFDERHRVRVLELEGGRSVEEAVDLMARAGVSNLHLVIDPLVSDRDLEVPMGSTPLEGTWDELVLGLAGAQRLAVEAHGLGRELRGGRGFLRICRHADRDDGDGLGVITRWCRQFQVGADDQQRARAARALAACAWPAALGWLAERWRLGDAAAEAGVLLAAGRGRLVRDFAQFERVRQLLDEALAALDRNPDRAFQRIDALANVAALAGGGEDLAELIRGPEGALSGPEGWARLVVLEGVAPGDEKTRAAVAGVLSSRSAQPRLRFQALQTWVALAHPSPESRRGARVHAPGELFRLAEPGVERRGLLERFDAVGVPPPEDWRVVPPEFSHADRLDLMTWWLDRGDAGGAGALIGGLEVVAADDFHNPDFGAVADRMRSWARYRESDVVGRALFQIQALLGVPVGPRHRAPTRLLARAGWLPDAQSESAYRTLFKFDSTAAAGKFDAATLGAFAGGPMGAKALAVLMAELEVVLKLKSTDAECREVFSGLERAFEELRARGSRSDVLELRRAIRRLARRKGGRWDQMALSPDWPPAPGLEPLPLVIFERRLGARELR